MIGPHSTEMVVGVTQLLLHCAIGLFAIECCFRGRERVNIRLARVQHFRGSLTCTTKIGEVSDSCHLYYALGQFSLHKKFIASWA